jgi:hypothetical protein
VTVSRHTAQALRTPLSGRRGFETEYEIKQGLVKSETMYKRGIHELSPAWDYFVVIVYRDMDAEVEVQKERAKVMKAVFPDTADFEQGDKKRWELITEHWDEKLIEVPLQ